MTQPTERPGDSADRATDGRIEQSRRCQQCPRRPFFRDDVPCTGAQTAPAPPGSGPPRPGSADRTARSHSAPRRTAASCAGPSAARDAAGETANIPPFGVAPSAASAAVPPLCAGRPGRRRRHRSRYLFVRFLPSHYRAPAVLGRERTSWEDTWTAMHVSHSPRAPGASVLDGSSGRRRYQRVLTG